MSPPSPSHVAPAGTARASLILREVAVGAMPAVKKFGSDGIRLCGTPGCTLPDHHAGPCSNWVTAKRERYVPPPPPAPKPKAAPAERKPKPAKERPASPPPVQELLPSGLYKYYHPLRWGVPLPAGPVDGDGAVRCDEAEADEGWRLEQAAARTRARPEVGGAQADLMALWNAHIAALPPIASDRALTRICRTFCREHAAQLAAELRAPLLSHLATLVSHQLLDPAGAHDCLTIVDALGADADAASASADGVLRARPVRGLELCPDCARPRHAENCRRQQAGPAEATAAAAGPSSSTHPASMLDQQAEPPKGGQGKKKRKMNW